MISYNKDNPWRPVNWRWERARLFNEGLLRGIPRKNEDDYTQAAIKFQQALDRCANDMDRYMLMEKNSALYNAYLVRRPSGNEAGNVQRWAIEARLLAAEPLQQIADKIGCTIAVVDWYEKLFFNVTEKLNAQDYIMTTAIGPSVYTGLSEREYDILWKVFGYLYGPVVLDAFLLGTTERNHATTNEGIDTKLDLDIASSIRRKAAICARTYTLNNFTQEGLMNIYVRFRELEDAKDSGGVAKDTFMQTIQVVMNKLPWANGDGIIRPDLPDSRPLDRARFLPYDSKQAELRTDELLGLTSGTAIPDPASLDNVTFPEPNNASNTSSPQ